MEIRHCSVFSLHSVYLCRYAVSCVDEFLPLFTSFLFVVLFLFFIPLNFLLLYPLFSLSLFSRMISGARRPSPVIQSSPLLKAASAPTGTTPDPSPSTRRREAFQRQPSLKRQSTINPTQSFSHWFLLELYRLLAFIFNKTRTVVLSLAYLTWRFLQLHLYKMNMFLLFACAISQVCWDIHTYIHTYISCVSCKGQPRMQGFIQK